MTTGTFLIRAAMALVFGVALSIPAAAAPLRVGVAEVELQFPEGLDMWGYTPRPNRGSFDPLFARIFVFDSGSRRLALVTLDLGRTFAVPRLDALRRRAAADAGIEEIVFVASHTHSGPYLRDSYEGGWPEWQGRVLDQIAEGLTDAAKDLFIARVGFGRGQVEIGHNRRWIEADGSVRMLWANPERIETTPVDPEVLVLRIDDPRGQTRAVLVGYACHPVVFGPDNLRYSADFPGVMASTVRSRLTGDPVVGFLQGAAGDINPYEDKRRLDDGAESKLQWTGETLGLEVARVVGAIDPTIVDEATLEFFRERRSFSLRSDRSSRVEGDLTALLIADRWAFVGLPGEPFVEFQLALKRRRLFEGNFLLGYADGYVRYLPTIQATEEGGYGADPEVAVVEVGAGESLMERAYEVLEAWRAPATP